MLKLNIKRLKQKAKKLKKEQQLTQAKALDFIAIKNEYSSWKALLYAHKIQTLENIPTSPLSLEFINSEDIQLDGIDKMLLKNERTLDLSKHSRYMFNNNKKELTKLGVEFSVFEPTLTGLKKNILDATQAIRTHFYMENFHDYEKQLCGQDAKIIKNAIFLEPQTEQNTNIRMYRPLTKSGDPRMWFSKLPSFCEASDQIAIIIYDDTAYLLNLSKINIKLEHTLDSMPIGRFLKKYLDKNNCIANELLSKLRVLSQNYIKATHIGDTAVGMSIENALDITANSSKLPDYKGIELKSGRNAKNRTSIFAQVPNWSKSKYKSSAKILEKFGYQRDNDYKLYCTVSTVKPNSQGLKFLYNKEEDTLEECFFINDVKIENVAIWDCETLRNRLLEKHSETFWIDAESVFIDGVEYFKLKKVTHTKSPVLSQLVPLLENGIITMDHLIKKSAKTGRTTEKGPLFKMNKKHFEFLFPEPITYELS
ncbi:MAG: MvaI/BcnI family restriction endonuclease [Ewingella americana]|jgi:hypothetical protein|uniref:MvaI/BcnI family restriction endonuclease n=1 Tax=Ewingella americana TaxID=41202 RepID=UPI00242CED85|nr:MvaI/BcnI family restriction endonuclease [Ewingella americana]MCI1680861.1 MvaI/BcnI family restriction endonuclease [Ewingella americana]MCI1855333.1 MvaI/BcnI family restriction endonuclease [Ewingella americana]MCI1862192.1 MvaI/BcnI family restriction endonuclease [Ewingella americana]MCI2143704.1 MvaI/BcnI family restriction endonuclease [Ewingella americana]MCI2165073.1 MvaI/BcnI family restriction endonuclease [Ewingella americana]